MGTRGYTLLCLFLVLATFSQCGLGQAGTTHVYNGASHDVAFRKYLFHNNGTTTFPVQQSVLAMGTADVFQVPQDVNCISTSYFQYSLQWNTIRSSSIGAPLACR